MNPARDDGSLLIRPIGIVHSCYTEKFGIPRQPGLVPSAWATVELFPEFAREEAVRGLEAYSHIWVIFRFHATAAQGWTPTVRPPRLGGNARVGVFATRSTFRPNAIGMSAVRLKRVEKNSGRVLLHLSGADLLDGTPVIDIKPYLPYADAIPDAAAGFAQAGPSGCLDVRFEPPAAAFCARCDEPLEALLREILAQDPRPSYHSLDGKGYGMRLSRYEVKWRVEGGDAVVTDIRPYDAGPPHA